jgi:hypothetical protein
VSNSKQRIAMIIKLLEANHIGSDGCLLVEEFERARNILCAKSLVAGERGADRASKDFCGYNAVKRDGIVNRDRVRTVGK